MTPKSAGRGARPYEVFISHSSDDSWVARQVAKAIRECGAHAFLSEELEGGDHIADEIRRAIERSREVLVHLTPWALESNWVWAEIGAAWIKRRRTVYLLHGQSPEDLRLNPKIPDFVLKGNLLDVNQIETGYLPQLRRRMG